MMPTPAAKTWDADSILDFLNHQRTTLQAMGVRRLGLFGSYVRHTQTPTSDVDFLLVMEHFTWQGWMDVWNFLEDNLGLKVDLVPEKDLREELRPVVLREARYVET